MISDEVRMLLNRMETNPDEFVDPVAHGFVPNTVMPHKWYQLLGALVENKPELSLAFEPEEVEALRSKLKELIRARVKASIVKHIVGGEDKLQMEMDLTDSTVYKKRALITQADLLRMKCDAEYLKNVAQQERFK
jgi:hypothetical protein